MQDNWTLGEAYESYMGRWSRPLARSFVSWLGLPPGDRWLEVGCGTGALTAAICELADPASVLACDPSESFVASARAGAYRTATYRLSWATSSIYLCWSMTLPFPGWC